jgi:peptidoglycan hydrolase-like protein with peptidoglycan-binding domain
MHFETNKTFLLPTAMKSIRRLKKFYDEHPKTSVLVSGHTDTVGEAGYNVTLSDERAQSMAAFLEDDVDTWMTFYAGAGRSESWGVREDQHMLKTLPDTDDSFYGDDVDGRPGPDTTAAIKKFQAFCNGNRGTNLAVDGVAGAETRRALVKEYMALDGTTLPPGTPLATHGCGFFHPSVPTPPDTDSLENRRVEVYFFETNVTPPPQDPCPDGGCPEYPQWVAQTVLTIDLGDDGPAANTKTLEIRLVNNRDEPLTGAKYRLTVGTEIFDDMTDGNGAVIQDIPADAEAGVLALDTWSVVLAIGDLDDGPASAKARLNNLGLAAGDDGSDAIDELATRAIERFQMRNAIPAAGKPPTGQLDGPTLQKLRDQHGS